MTAVVPDRRAEPVVKAPRPPQWSQHWADWFLNEVEPLFHSAMETSAEYRRKWTRDSPLRFALTYLEDPHLRLQDSDPPLITFNEMHLSLCVAAKRWMQPKRWREGWVAPRGVGKALALDTPVLTVDRGWTTHGDLRVGDRVFDERGVPCNVVRVSERWTDRPCYRLTFSDGEQIVADERHEWWVNDRYSELGERTVETERIAEKWLLTEARGRREVRYSVPVAGPLQYPPADLPIAPYVLGAWLGDGTTTAGAITAGAQDVEQLMEQLRAEGENPVAHARKTAFCVNLAKPRPHLCPREHELELVQVGEGLDQIGRRRKDKYRPCRACVAAFQWHSYRPETAIGPRTNRPLIARLRDLGVLGDKHVPEQYQAGSVEQRLALLQGLMDTDGSVTARGYCEFSASNERLARDVLRLVLSLGIKAKLRERRAMIGGVDHGPTWRVSFFTTLPVFRLPRKLARIATRMRAAGNRRIVDVERVENQPTSCIEVDSPSHLYLVGRALIPTHNSSWCFLALPLWALAHGHRSYFMAFSADAGMAQNQLANLRQELDPKNGNAKLLGDYPELALRKGFGGSNTKATVVANGGTIAAAGLGQNTLGRKSGANRPDLIICHQVGTPMLHDGRWVPVEEHPSYRGSRVDEGREVAVWGLPFTETVTPEHRYWAKWAWGTRRKYRDAEWVEACDLDEFHYIGTPIDMTERPAPAWIENVKVDGLSRDERGRVYGTAWESRLVRPDRLDDPEFWWMVGYWWGNGHVGSPRDEGPNYATVAVTIPDSRPDLVRRLRGLVTAKIGVTPRVGCTQYSWSDAPLARWLRTWKEADAGQAEKAPPAWVEQLPLHLQRRLVEGYANADGDETSDVEVRVSSIHLPGLLMLRRIQARLGVAVTIRKGPGPRPTAFPDGRRSWSKQKYDARWSLRQDRYSITRTHIADGMLWSKVRSVSEVPVAEFAPIKTPDSTYVTAFGLSHNCDDIEPLDETMSDREKRSIILGLTAGVIPMASPQAAIGIFGTTTSYGSVIHDLAQHARGRERVAWIENNEITPRLFPGIKIDPDTGEERSLWPERWPLTETHLGEWLRRTVDGRVPDEFMRNFLLDPTVFGDEAGSFWRPELIQHKDYRRVPGIVEHALYLDVAVTATRSADQTAAVIVGKHPKAAHATVEYAEAWNISPDEIHRRVKRLVERYPTVRTVIVENNQGGDLWLDVVSPSYDPLPRHVRLETEHVRTSKRDRVADALRHYERGAVFHCAEFVDLERQMVLFPSPKSRDDLVDALTGGLRWAFNDPANRRLR